MKLTSVLSEQSSEQSNEKSNEKIKPLSVSDETLRGSILYGYPPYISALFYDT
jgi:hypothetical protein